jgi:hypothetical protein
VVDVDIASLSRIQTKASVKPDCDVIETTTEIPERLNANCCIAEARCVGHESSTSDCSGDLISDARPFGRLCRASTGGFSRIP